MLPRPFGLWKVPQEKNVAAKAGVEDATPFVGGSEPDVEARHFLCLIIGIFDLAQFGMAFERSKSYI